MANQSSEDFDKPQSQKIKNKKKTQKNKHKNKNKSYPWACARCTHCIVHVYAVWCVWQTLHSGLCPPGVRREAGSALTSNQKPFLLSAFYSLSLLATVMGIKVQFFQHSLLQFILGFISYLFLWLWMGVLGFNEALGGQCAKGHERAEIRELLWPKDCHWCQHEHLPVSCMYSPFICMAFV